MQPSDPRVLAVATAIVGLVDALAAERKGDAADELVAFPFGFERRGASALIRQGKLATTKIGRRIYARRSDVLSLVGDAAKVTREDAPTASDAAAAARAAYGAASVRVVPKGRGEERRRTG